MSKTLNSCMLCDGRVTALGGSRISWWLGNAERRARWGRWSFNIRLCDVATTGLWQNIGADDRDGMEATAKALKAAVAASEGMHALNLHVERTTKYSDPAAPWCGDEEFVLSHVAAKSHHGIRLGLDPTVESARYDAAEALARRWRLHAGADRPGGPFVLSLTERHRFEPADPRMGRRAGEDLEGAFAVFAPQQWTFLKASLLGLADTMLESVKIK